jgi:predicted metal-dependent phosphoesterase TrpH
MIDLHCHSHFSDGALSPTVLLEKAIRSGIKLLAMTDHDTTAGLDELHNAANGVDIQIINGIELSTRWKKHDIHILGLNIKPDADALLSLIAKQNKSRILRAKTIAQSLSSAGIQNTYQKAYDIAGHERLGRPHFAQVLVNEGLVPDLQAAFKHFLGRGKIAYVPTEWVSVQDATTSIIEAGGCAVIAHPLKYKLTRSKLNTLITEFKSAGGHGLEVVSGEMIQSQINELAGLCLRFDLMASSGSDYHHELSRTGLGQQRQLPVNCQPVWHDWIN